MINPKIKVVRAGPYSVGKWRCYRQEDNTAGYGWNPFEAYIAWSKSLEYKSQREQEERAKMLQDAA